MAPRLRPLLTPPNDGTQKENKLDLRVAPKKGAGHAEDRRAVPAEPSRHLVRAELHLPPAFDLAAFRKGKVGKPNLHSVILSWLNPLLSTESRISG